MYPSLVAHEVSFPGDGGETINAYFARPDPAHPGDGPYPGVVVLHHLMGLDEGTMEIVRKFAAHGYITVCPNLHSREAREHGQENAWAASRAAGGVPDQRLVGDLAGALHFLRASDGCSGKGGVIGYCSGGRQAFLGACSRLLDPEAGHGFFAADREDHYNVKAAVDGWQQVFAFFERNLH